MDTTTTAIPADRALRVIVFSKDRPLQLHATLSTMWARCQDTDVLDVQVLVYASDDEMARRYQQVAREVPFARLVPQQDFKETLLAMAHGARFLGFVCDDALFVRDWSAASALKMLLSVPKAIGLSLRLGQNTTVCYSRGGLPQPVPPSLELIEGWRACDWPQSQLDFAYPLELSSSVYRFDDVWHLLEALPYGNPNQLEDALFGRVESLAAAKPALLYPSTSIAFCTPINVVQSTHPNRNAGRADLTPAALAAHFDAGYRVDVEALRGFTPNACHQEIQLPLRGGAARAPAPAAAAATPSGVEREEFDHLSGLLGSLPPHGRKAVDVGANVGEVTLHLARMGYQVLALEPNPEVAAQVLARLEHERLAERCRMLQVAASAGEGTAELIVGTAHTVATLSADWTRVAFPEHFQQPRRIAVPTRPLLSVLREEGFTGAAFVKIDVEGHEVEVLQGLLAGAAPAELPAAIMFEANQRFPELARRCLALLGAAGYDTFDVFIKDGRLLGATRFAGTALPALWSRCDQPGTYFYANFIAYRGDRLGAARLPPAPGGSASQPPAPAPAPGPGAAPASPRPGEVLARARAVELAHPFPVHREWEAERQELRAFVQAGALEQFLRHPVCTRQFVRGGFGPGQRFELETLQRDALGRELLARAADPDVGGPSADTPVPGLSANSLGMAYYLWRLRRWFPDGLPRRVVEMGAGFGALARLYALEAPEASYTILDLPEMLELQHFYLERTLGPGRVAFADAPPVAARPGVVTLVPAPLLREVGAADLFLSTFAFSELPREAQRQVDGLDYFGARRIFLAGQLATERPSLEWVGHAEVIGPIVQRFQRVAVERFHLGDNYLLQAER